MKTKIFCIKNDNEKILTAYRNIFRDRNRFHFEKSLRILIK